MRLSRTSVAGYSGDTPSSLRPLVLALVISLLAFGTVSGATLRVCVSETYTTIAGPISEASNGHTSGGVVYCDVGSDVTVYHCTISQNTAAVSGGGVFSNVGANLVASDSTISSNSAIGIGGGLVVLGVTNSQIARCLVSANASG